MKVSGKKVIYKGLFLDEESSQRMKDWVDVKGTHLDKWINDLHVTFEFKPEEGFSDDLLGVEWELEVIAYGNDGNVSGFEVVLPKDLELDYVSEAIPHITTSIAEGAKAFETGYIDFNEIDKFYVYGHLGYFTGGSILLNN